MAGFNDPSKRELTVSAQDTISFHWQGGKHHNVWSLPDRKSFDNCDFTVGHKLGDTSPVTYNVHTFPTHYFACYNTGPGEPGHCRAGQKLAVTGDIKF